MEILVKTYRGELLDLFTTGSVAVVDYEGKLLYSAGDPEQVAYARSSAKLMQAMVPVTMGVADEYNWTEQEVAQICASHSGEQIHIDTVRSILKKSGLDESYLQCGAHFPFKADVTIEMRKNGIEPTDIHNNCSGKHAGMLATVKFLNEDLSTYYKVEHPHQKRIVKMISEICSYPESSIVIGLDGCGVPVHALPLDKFAFGMARMAKPESLGEKLAPSAKRIVEAVMHYPVNVSGSDRIDNMIMQKYPGRIAVKVGANGYFVASIPEMGVGVALKVDDGKGQSSDIVLLETLYQIGFIPQEDLEFFSEKHRPVVYNHKKELAGRSEACFTLRKY
ncbi:MAG: asparaginase [Oscillospiraceae bacterium]